MCDGRVDGRGSQVDVKKRPRWLVTTRSAGCGWRSQVWTTGEKVRWTFMVRATE